MISSISIILDSVKESISLLDIRTLELLHPIPLILERLRDELGMAPAGHENLLRIVELHLRVRQRLAETVECDFLAGLLVTDNIGMRRKDGDEYVRR